MIRFNDLSAENVQKLFNKNPSGLLVILPVEYEAKEPQLWEIFTNEIGKHIAYTLSSILDETAYINFAKLQLSYYNKLYNIYIEDMIIFNSDGL